MDTQTLILSAASAIMVALLGWIGKILVEIKSNIAVLNGQISYVRSNHDELKEWSGRHDVEIKELRKDVTILKTKMDLP